MEFLECIETKFRHRQWEVVERIAIFFGGERIIGGAEVLDELPRFKLHDCLNTSPEWHRGSDHTNVGLHWDEVCVFIYLWVVSYGWWIKHTQVGVTQSFIGCKQMNAASRSRVAFDDPWMVFWVDYEIKTDLPRKIGFS